MHEIYEIVNKEAGRIQYYKARNTNIDKEEAGLQKFWFPAIKIRQFSNPDPFEKLQLIKIWKHSRMKISEDDDLKSQNTYNLRWKIYLKALQR